MTDSNANVLGLGTITAIVIVFAVGLGVVLGLYSEQLGLSGGLRGGLIGVSVGLVATLLMRRRQAALRAGHGK